MASAEAAELLFNFASGAGSDAELLLSFAREAEGRDRLAFLSKQRQNDLLYTTPMPSTLEALTGSPIRSPKVKGRCPSLPIFSCFYLSSQCDPAYVRRGAVIRYHDMRQGRKEQAAVKDLVLARYGQQNLIFARLDEQRTLYTAGPPYREVSTLTPVSAPAPSFSVPKAREFQQRLSIPPLNIIYPVDQPGERHWKPTPGRGGLASRYTVDGVEYTSDQPLAGKVGIQSATIMSTAGHALSGRRERVMRSFSVGDEVMFVSGRALFAGEIDRLWIEPREDKAGTDFRELRWSKETKQVVVVQADISAYIFPSGSVSSHTKYAGIIRSKEEVLRQYYCGTGYLAAPSPPLSALNFDNVEVSLACPPSIHNSVDAPALDAARRRRHQYESGALEVPERSMNKMCSRCADAKVYCPGGPTTAEEQHQRFLLGGIAAMAKCNRCFRDGADCEHRPGNRAGRKWTSQNILPPLATSSSSSVSIAASTSVAPPTTATTTSSSTAGWGPSLPLFRFNSPAEDQLLELRHVQDLAVGELDEILRFCHPSNRASRTKKKTEIVADVWVLQQDGKIRLTGKHWRQVRAPHKKLDLDFIICETPA